MACQWRTKDGPRDGERSNETKRIALINTNKSSKLYPVSLLKIGHYLKSIGGDVVLYDNKLPENGDFDEIWITTLFTFDVPYSQGFVKEAMNRASKVKVGGVSASLLPEKFKQLGAEVHVGLMPEVELHSPDYSLLGIKPEYSISYLSRGCVRKCGFCMVPKLEGKFQKRESWLDDINESKKVLFYDNNWLATPIKKFTKDCNELHELVKSDRIREIDFNQGLDCRLLTKERAELLKGLPIKPVRFAFDGMHEDGFYQDAVRMMADYGFKDFMSYVLYNFTDTTEDFYYRLKESIKLKVETGVSVASFPMRYQPILDIDDAREYVGEHWSQQMRKNYMSMLSHSSLSGQVSQTSISEFEYWYGKDAETFKKLLNYPKLRELMKKKQGNLRMERAIKKAGNDG